MLYFSTGPKDACWDSRESGILENLGSGITSFNFSPVLDANAVDMSSGHERRRLVQFRHEIRRDHRLSLELS